MTEKEIKTNSSHERSKDVEYFSDIAKERRTTSDIEFERINIEQKTHESEDEVLAEAQKLAQETVKTDEEKKSSKNTERRNGPISKKQLDASFKAQLKSAEHDMNTFERLLSRSIHVKPIEKTTDLIASTIARPNAMLSGSVAAFAGITIIYFVSKYYGFRLTGFETIGAFILGWVIGLLYDYFKTMIRGKR